MSAAQFAYLDTRVAVFAGRLLDDRAVAALASGEAERAAVLRRAGLEAGGRLDEAGPRVLEQAVAATLVREAEALARPLTGAARDALIYWTRRLEVMNLKLVIRGVVSGLGPDAIREGLLDLGGMGRLPVDAAVHAEDLSELLRRLEDTAYADMARHARGVYEEQRAAFDLEAALDREYFRGLAERANALPDTAGRELRRLVGVLIDQMNLVWLLRYRYTYGLEPAHTYLLLIPAGRLLEPGRLLDLVKLEAVEDVLEALPPRLRGLMMDAHSIEAVETAMRRETTRVARSVLGFTTFNVGRACAYLLLREWQLWRIYGVLEGARLNLHPEVIRAAVRLRGDGAEAG